jgi:hypothetical protein
MGNEKDPVRPPDSPRVHHERGQHGCARNRAHHKESDGPDSLLGQDDGALVHGVIFKFCDPAAPFEVAMRRHLAAHES